MYPALCLTRLISSNLDNAMRKVLFFRPTLQMRKCALGEVTSDLSEVVTRVHSWTSIQGQVCLMLGSGS